MAGGHGDFQPVRLDPAIERWNAMRENVYQHFRFTRRSTGWVLLFGLAVPAAIAGIAMRYDNKFDWAGKVRGTSLRAGTPNTPAPAKEEAEE